MMNTISMNDFRADSEELLRAELVACERVLRSGWWILGQEVVAFEREWAQWLGLPEAVGCGNGLDAIEIGLRGLGIGPGDEVITTPMTAFATVLAVIRAGASPVLADIDTATGMLDPESVRRCLSPRTKAILLVHLYGRVGPVEELNRLAEEAGIYFLEDCAQAHGAKLRGRPAGSYGAFSAWSFYPTKNLGAIGDAGALVTASAELAAKARSLRNYGQSVRYYHPLFGMNSRLDELQASILRERLKYLQSWNLQRRSVAALYTSNISNPHLRVMPMPADPDEHVHHLFVVLTPHRDRLQEHLKELGIESNIHYPVPAHFQEPCKQVARDPSGLERAERHAASCLSLPCHHAMTTQKAEKVVAAINGFKV